VNQLIKKDLYQTHFVITLNFEIDLIRIAVDAKGVVGFIDITAKMTLEEARQKIIQQVENVPLEFQFVLQDGVPISKQQEQELLIVLYQPCIKIQDVKKDLIRSSRFCSIKNIFKY